MAESLVGVFGNPVIQPNVPSVSESVSQIAQTGNFGDACDRSASSLLRGRRRRPDEEIEFTRTSFRSPAHPGFVPLTRRS
jgi:hypothetical protein